jgi:hypothetical protein
VSRLRYLTTVSIVLLLSALGSSAKADVFGDLARIATDPLKLDSSSERVKEATENIMSQIPGLLDQANSIGQQRLAQLQTILNTTVAGGISLEDHAFAQLTTLEKQVNSDAINFLYRAHCAALVTLQQDVQKAAVTAVQNLSKEKPTLTLFGVRIASLTADQVSISEPDQTYVQTRDLVISHLNSDITETSNAYEIVSAYRNLENLARDTQCFYLDNPSAQVDFVNEASRFQVSQQAWAAVAPPELLPNQPDLPDHGNKPWWRRF